MTPELTLRRDVAHDHPASTDRRAGEPRRRVDGGDLDGRRAAGGRAHDVLGRDRLRRARRQRRRRARATQWLFGEGSQGFFDTYVLLANAGATAATATVHVPAREGARRSCENVDVAPTSRLNVFAGGIPELVNQSFSIVVTSTHPIIAERAMYFGSARLFDGGHESAGVPRRRDDWFLAEGATGSFFNTFILVGNPNPAPATVTLTFLPTAGRRWCADQEGARPTPAHGEHGDRRSALANAAVSTTVTSDAAGHLGTGDVLAGRVRDLVRGAQQLRRDDARRRNGVSRKAASAAQASRPTSCWPIRARRRPTSASRSCGPTGRRS